MSHLLLLVTCSESEGNLESTTFSAFLAEAAQSKGKLRKLQRNPVKGSRWQKLPKAKENFENCRENKPYAICLYVVTCSNSAGNLGNGRKKLGLVPLSAMKSLKRCFAAMGKAWKLQLFQHFSRSRPKQRKTLKIAEKISHVLCAFISDMLKIRRKPGNYNFFSIFGRSRPKQRKT